MQEYFASLNLTSEYGAAEIARLQPQNWWRETILFAIAREQNPAPYVLALFESSPMMGAMAVAEAPTPSLHLQETAINLSLKQLDAEDEKSILPIVSLLRKVTGKVERDLCSALGIRLETDKAAVSAMAGRALATAGTALATETLSHYPTAWDHCLESAAYLSATFEKMLVSWVRNANHPYWHHAVDLLVKRFQRHARDYLIRLLQSLPDDKSDYLACLITKKLYAQEFGITDGSHYYLEYGHYLDERRYYFARGSIFPMSDTMMRILPYIKNARALSQELAKMKQHESYGSGPGLVLTSLALTELLSAKKQSDGTTLSQTAKIRKTLMLTRDWCEERSPYYILLASCPPLLITNSFFRT